jgi:hypothetical protein
MAYIGARLFSQQLWSPLDMGPANQKIVRPLSPLWVVRF